MEGVAASQEPSHRSYRSTFTGWVAAFFVCIGLLAILAGVSDITDPQKGISDARTKGIVWVAFGILVIVWSVKVVARMGLTTSDKGVVIHGWVRRRFVAWNEIAGFSFGSDIPNLTLGERFFSPTLSSYMLLADGRHLALTGLRAIRVNRTNSRAKIQLLLGEMETQRRYFMGE
jgi:hypothetical protein